MTTTEQIEALEIELATLTERFKAIQDSPSFSHTKRVLIKIKVERALAEIAEVNELITTLSLMRVCEAALDLL